MQGSVTKTTKGNGLKWNSPRHSTHCNKRGFNACDKAIKTKERREGKKACRNRED